jgi:hypothetical protein
MVNKAWKTQRTPACYDQRSLGLSGTQTTTIEIRVGIPWQVHGRDIGSSPILTLHVLTTSVFASIIVFAHARLCWTLKVFVVVELYSI